ncbi:MAG: NUMOD4 domain-containing protein [Candidatus Saccharicenans sp.]
MTEKWKPIKGYEDLYVVSNLGNIKNSKGKILKSGEIDV